MIKDVQDIKIEKVLSDFIHQEKHYIIFSTNYSAYDFLLLSHLNKNIQSLFFGKDLHKLVQALMKKSKDICIECNLGLRIEGGVANDGEQIVEFNFNITQSNEIIKKLKKKMKMDLGYIKTFES